MIHIYSPLFLKGFFHGCIAVALIIASPLFGAVGEEEWSANVEVQDAPPAAPVLDENQNLYVLGDSELKSFDAVTGKFRWRIELSTTASSGLSLGMLLYYGNENGELIADSTEDGSRQWNFQGQGNIVGAPAVDAEGTVFVTTAEGYVYAVEEANGDKIWEATLDGELTSAALGNNGLLYVGSDSGLVYALSQETGDVQWDFTTAGPVVAAPALDQQNSLYIGDKAGQLYCLSAEGEKKWEFSAEAGIRSNAVLGAGNTLFVAAGSTLYAVDRSGGDQIWKRSFDLEFQAAPVLGADGTLYIGDKGAPDDLDRFFLGTFYALNADTGEILWSDAIDGGYSGSAVVTEKRVIFPAFFIVPGGGIGFSGYIYAYHASSYGLAATPWPRYQGNHQSTGRVTLQGPTIEESLNADDLAFYTGGDVPFSDQTNFAYESGHAMQSGSIDDDGRSVLSATLQGPGTLKFQWKVSSESDADYLEVYVNDQLQQKISGETDWSQVSLDVRDGKQVVEWIYSKNGSAGAGEDAGWIDTVQWVPSGESRLKWKTELGAAEPSSPALHPSGQVVAGTDDAYVRALSQETGEILWDSIYDTQQREVGAVEAAPVIAGGKVVVGTAGRILLDASYDDQLLAFNHESGNLLWNEGLGTGAVKFPAALDPADGNMILSVSQFFSKINETDGTRMYEMEVDFFEIFTPPVVDQTRVFAGGGDSSTLNPELGAAQRDTGQNAWEIELASPLAPGLALDENGTLFTGTAAEEEPGGIFYAIDKNTGDVEWEFEVGSTVGTAPVVGYHNLVYFGATDHRLYALDRNSGEVRWDFDSGAAIHSTPAVGLDGMIYFGNDDGQLYALDGETGEAMWSYKAGQAIQTAPALNEEGVLFFGSQDGFLYALQTSSMGLARTAWPKYQHDNQNTGMLLPLQFDLEIAFADGASDPMLDIAIRGIPGREVTLESSSDLNVWSQVRQLTIETDGKAVSSVAMNPDHRFFRVQSAAPGQE